MNRKQKVISTVASVACIGLLASCGGSSSSDSDDEVIDEVVESVTPGEGEEVEPVVVTGNSPLDGPTDTGVSINTLDRMGRPGITTATIELRSDRTIYNQNGDPSTWAAEFQALIRERLVTIDGLDGVAGNALLDVDTIAGLLVDDRLQIDTSVPECDVYLALEIGLGGCGGRTLERDVIDDTLRHLVAQDMPVSDNALNDSVILNTWPFLGEALNN